MAQAKSSEDQCCFFCTGTEDRKYWQIPGEALLVIDGLRRKKPENHKLPSEKI